MSFILYDLFKRRSANDPSLTAETKKDLISKIKTLDKEGKENLYRLIRYAAFLNSDDTVFIGKFQKKGVIFDLEVFPDDLQKLIFSFVNKHLEETLQPRIVADIVFE